MVGSDTRGYPAHLQPIQGFQPLKAVQLCALFAAFSEGHIEKLKLIKLIYLTERRFLQLFSEPILWDEFYSLPHGPICSATLNCIDGVLFESLVQQYVVTSGRRNVHSTRSFTNEDFDALSEAEIEVAHSVWLEHKDKTASQIRNFTHLNCPEYFELNSGRRPISYVDLLRALGSDHADDIAEDIFSYRQVISGSY